MFVVLKKENSKTNVVSIQTTLAEAKAFMLAEALKNGKMGPNTTDEGVFIVETENTVEERKNTLQTIEDKGWIYNDTKKELKNELVAEYSFLEVPENVVKTFVEKNKPTVYIPKLMQGETKPEERVQPKKQDPFNILIDMFVGLI
jgi:hypothetical protein